MTRDPYTPLATHPVRFEDGKVPCPMCGSMSDWAWFGQIRVIGCPCVGDRVWVTPTAITWFDERVSKCNHDPGDEDRS